MLALAVLLLCAAGLLYDFRRIGRPDLLAAANVSDQVPTLFIPGYFGNRYSFGHMLRRLPASKQVVAVVRKDGSVHLRGKLQLGVHATVQVLFSNKQIRPLGQLAGISAVVAALQKQAAFSQINLVAHSMGGIGALMYIVSKPAVPVAAFVSIAAPFNDVEVAKNSPISDLHLTPAGPKQIAPVYAYFQKHQGALPKKLRWLNIAGDLFIGPLASDGAVGVNSSFSIRYLAQSRVASYIEVVIRGPQAAHSLLHENHLVDRDISDFLWQQHLGA